jgi:hypothetical protein
VAQASHAGDPAPPRHGKSPLRCTIRPRRACHRACRALRILPDPVAHTSQHRLGLNARAPASLAVQLRPRRRIRLPKPPEPSLAPRSITHPALVLYGQTAPRIDPCSARTVNAGELAAAELCSGESRRRPARPFAQGRRIKILRPTTNPAESIPQRGQRRRFC